MVSGGAHDATAGYGGVVRLEIAEDAVINGEISADGVVNDKYRGAGAGGSIWIQCLSIYGEGTICARSYDPLNNGRGGGGGRIAIGYSGDTNAWTGDLTYPDSVLGVDGGELGTIVWTYIAPSPPKGTVVSIR